MNVQWTLDTVDQKVQIKQRSWFIKEVECINQSIKLLKIQTNINLKALYFNYRHTPYSHLLIGISYRLFVYLFS